MGDVDIHLVLAIIPKVGAMISIPCSLFIMWESLEDHQNGKGSPIQRTLVGMSAFDVMASFGWFFSTWTVPKNGDTPLSAGNIATCNFQGFLLQLAIGVSTPCMFHRNGASMKESTNLDPSRS